MVQKQGVSIGIQAGDDLIKLANDRVMLLERQRHMFYASGGTLGGGDNYGKMDGSFSPVPRHAKNALIGK